MKKLLLAVVLTHAAWSQITTLNPTDVVNYNTLNSNFTWLNTGRYVACVPLYYTASGSIPQYSAVVISGGSVAVAGTGGGGVTGVAQSSVTNGQSVGVCSEGLSYLTMDATATQGHLAIPSTSTGGYGHDSGQTSRNSIGLQTGVLGTVVTGCTGSACAALVSLEGMNRTGRQINSGTPITALSISGCPTGSYVAADGSGCQNIQYDVRFWGAKCDGSTDDTTALQSAINAVPSGSTLVFGIAGNVCLISSALTGKPNLTYTGQATIKMKSGSTAHQGLIDFQYNASNNVTITGLTFDSNSLGGCLQFSVSGAGSIPATNVLIQGNTFLNTTQSLAGAWDEAIYNPVGFVNSKIVNNVFNTDGGGIYVVNPQITDVTDNYFYSIHQADAIFFLFSNTTFTYGQQINVLRNRGYDLGAMAIEVQCNVGTTQTNIVGMMVADNHFENWWSSSTASYPFGISIVAGFSATVTRNTIRHSVPSSGTAMELSAPNSTVSDNFFDDFPEGVSLLNATGGTIKGNLVTNMTTDCINITNNSGTRTNLLIKANTLTNCQVYGITDVDSSWGGSTIEDNIITRTGGAFTGDSSATYYGMALTEPTTTPVNVVHNTIIQNSASAPSGFTFIGIKLNGSGSASTGSVYNYNTISSNTALTGSVGIYGASSGSFDYALVQGNVLQNLGAASGGTSSSHMIHSMNQSVNCTSIGPLYVNDLTVTPGVDVNTSNQVVGVKGVPLCSGFTPTTGQALVYTTASSPNPCYTASTAGGGGSSAVLTSVSYSSTPTFTVSSSSSPWIGKMTLTGNVSSSTLTTSSATNGQSIGFIIVQSSRPLASGTYTSGITATGTIGQTCTLTSFNGGGSSATATVALTGSNAIAGGTALMITAGGSGYTSTPTSATVGSGTATCSGAPVLSTTVSGPYTFSWPSNVLNPCTISPGVGVTTTLTGTFDGTNVINPVCTTNDPWHGASIAPANYSLFPSCSSNYNGTIGSVNDSTTTVMGAVVSGGSSGNVLMYCDGSSWKVLSGTVLPSVPVVISTSGPVSDPGGPNYYLYNNASGALTFNLIAGVAGYQRCYRNATGNSGVITIAVTTSNAIDLGGTNGTTTSGTLVSGGAAGDAVCLVSDATNHWYAYVQKGTWTNN